MIRSGLATVDAQAKLAQSLGTTVASIQVLERAGELAGVAMSGIEQATKDLTRRLSQAAAGAGPAAEALGRLGLSASELLALPLDERVGRINQAIADFVPGGRARRGRRPALRRGRLDRHGAARHRDAAPGDRGRARLRRRGLGDRRRPHRARQRRDLPARADLARALEPARGRRRAGARGGGERDGRGSPAPPARSASRSAGSSTTSAGSRAMPPPSPASWPGAGSPGWSRPRSRSRGLATALVVLRGALIRTGIGALDRRRRRDGLPVHPAGRRRRRLRRGAVAPRRRRRPRSGSGSSRAATPWRCRCSRSGRGSRPAG